MPVKQPDEKSSLKVKAHVGLFECRGSLAALMRNLGSVIQNNHELSYNLIDTTHRYFFGENPGE